MSIRIGAYDFFAHTVPGALYLLIAAILAVTISGYQIEPLSLHPDITQILLIAIASYVVGILADEVCVRTWYRLFHIRNLPDLVLGDFQDLHPNIDIKFSSHDWPILKAYIYKNQHDWSLAIEQLNALHIMMRNLSFNLIMLGALSIALGARTNIIYLATGVVFILLSIVAGKRSITLKRWFFSGIYETVIAQGLSPSDLYTRRDDDMGRTRTH